MPAINVIKAALSWSSLKRNITIAINETKYDADSTYVEMKRFKCLFIYKDKNVLHIKAN